MGASMHFEYIRLGDRVADDEREAFVIKISCCINAESRLIRELAENGIFPDYFGWNWDSVLDCLRDFSWIKQPEIILMHEDVPLIRDRTACRFYLEMLEIAVVDWLTPRKDNIVFTFPNWPFVAHRLRVVFPQEAREFVEAVMR